MRWVLCAVLLAFLAAACAPSSPTCADPYIPNGNTCCLDKDGNGICDVDEGGLNASAGTAVSCDLCPPKFVTQTEEVIVYKYVCANGTVVPEAADCGIVIRSNADQFEVNTLQDSSIVESFEARPACRGEFRVAELHLEMLRNPRQITLQAQSDPDGGFTDIATISGDTNLLDNEYFYIGFCREIECGGITQGQLDSSTAHLVRARLIFSGEETLTRDLLLDPTPQGEYGQKKC